MILGSIPALPLHTAGKYVAGAYIVLFAIVLIYVAIMAVRLSRIEGELGKLLNIAASISDDDASPASSPQRDGERRASPDEEEGAAEKTLVRDSASSTERESTPA